MQENQFDKIIPVNLEDEMQKSYIDYAMSVIVARALPDVRDGLKPVHRRILYSMNELNLDPSKAHKKSARIVGDTMGKYHPHGDSSIYDALVRMAQDFSMRYPLVDGHGNFGSIDGYEAAAQRYTEARLSRLSMEMLADIEKNTVDFIPNYDEEFLEPSVLPARYPNLLVNGSSGIAVGMATNIPPHNLAEVIDAIVKIIDNHIDSDRETEIDELLSIIKGPDYPTGGSIIGTAGINSAYRTGRGKLRLRSEVSVEEMPGGRERIIVTEIPYQVNKAKMIEKMADLIKDKRIDGISDIRDESDRTGIRIIIELKRDTNSTIVLNQLYKFSQLQETYSLIMLALVDNQPRILNLKEMLTYYLDYQKEVVTRRTRFDLDKALKRSHILEGLIKALDHIDEIISIIRSSKDTVMAKERLTERFDFSELQVSAIVEMRLRSLTGLEREKLEKEYADIKELIKYLEAILADEKRLYAVIREEILIIKTKYADERKTKIVPDYGEIVMEDLIEDDMSVITMTHLNYIKRIPLSTYKSQNRGGKGIKGMETRDEDFVRNLFLSSNHSLILFFTNKGKVYSTKTYEIPEASRIAKGTPIVNLLELDEGEKISAVIPVREFSENDYLMMITKSGIAKKTDLALFSNIRRNGLKAVGLKEDDELISVLRTDGEKEIFIATRLGMAIRFNESDIRSMGRQAAGVKAIRLRKDDAVVAAEMLLPEHKILMVTENGFGKCTQISEYHVQKRGGKGLKSHNITEKTGNIVGVNVVNDNEELIMITSEGIVIRIRVNDISTVGRVTQGVKLINIAGDVSVVGTAKITEEHIDNDDGEEEDIYE